MTFRALTVDQDGDATAVALKELTEADLPEGEVTIDVSWSSVNYKDGLATSPGGRVVTNYPMVPGIDLAGTVRESSDARFKAGDSVLAHGYEIGTGHWGGYSEVARVPADWVVPLPAGLSAKEAMALGTAGFTAAMSVLALERNGLETDDGPVLVVGATGGVGSTAVSMLAGRGYTVAASTGKASEHDYLKGLGATEILGREETSAESKRPLEKERWGGAVDPVGGSTTAYLIRTMKYGGSVAVSGMTGGPAYSSSVFPHILRGVNVLGIDSVFCDMAERQRIWNLMGGELKPAGLLESIAHETDLDGLPAVLGDILQAKIRGRVLVRCS